MCAAIVVWGVPAPPAGGAGGAAAEAAIAADIDARPPDVAGDELRSPAAGTELSSAVEPPVGAAPVDAGVPVGEEPPQILPAQAPGPVAGEDDPVTLPAAVVGAEGETVVGGSDTEPDAPIVDVGVPLSDDDSATPWQSWSFDGFWQVDRPLADPGVLDQPLLDGVTVYGTTARICVLFTCGTYWVPRYTSSSLANTAGIQGDAMPDRPPWVSATNRAIWAPSVIELDGAYVMYFAATAGSGPNLGLKCIGAALAATPAGPFVPEAAPLVCGPTGYWAIDPYALADDGHLYLLWREDDSTHVLGKIVSAELNADGLSLAGTPPVTLMEGVETWEDADPVASRPPPSKVGPDPGPRSYPPYAIEVARTAALLDDSIGPIENPAIVRDPDTGEWVLTWSANAWETQNYATGLATCEGPLGPCTRISTDSPWLRTSTDAGISTSAQFGGAGGMSFCHGPDGMVYAFFHAYRGTGNATTAPRITWVYRLEPDIEGYHLYEYDPPAAPGDPDPEPGDPDDPAEPAVPDDPGGPTDPAAP